MTEHALDFGSGDSISTSFDTSFGTGAFSVSFWVQSSTSGGFSHIIRDYDGSDGWYIRFHGGDYSFVVSDSSTTVENREGSYPGDVPTHLVWIREADGTLTLYQDGELEGSQANDSPNANSPSTLEISPGGQDHLLDDVRLYDREITASEASNLATGVDVTSGLIAHWPFDEGSGSTATDTTGSNDGTLNGDPQWVDPLAHIDSAHTFDGQMGQGQMGKTQMGATYTISERFASSRSSTIQTDSTRAYTASRSADTYASTFQNASSRVLSATRSADTHASAIWTGASRVASYTRSADTHLAAIWADSTLFTPHWLIDTRQIRNLTEEVRDWKSLELTFRSSQSLTKDRLRPLDTDTGKFEIVERADGSYDVVDRSGGGSGYTLVAPTDHRDLRSVQDYAIAKYTETPVDQQFNDYEVRAEFIAQNPKPSISGSSTARTPDEWLFEFADGDISTGRVGKEIGRGGETIEGTVELTVTLTRAQARKLEASLNRQANVRIQEVPDGADKVRDENSNSRNTVRVTPPPGYALDFDGSGDYVGTPYAGDFGTGAFSVSGFINLNDTPYQAFVSSFDSSGSGWSCEYHASNDQYRFLVTGDDLRIGPNPTVGETDHVVWVKRANGERGMIINGTSTAFATHDSNVDSNDSVNIGRRPTSDDYADATINDVRIYDRDLSESEASDLNDGENITNGLVGHWPFDEGSGSTAGDAAGGNDGTLNGDPQWVKGLTDTTDAWDTVPPGDYVVEEWETTLLNEEYFTVDLTMHKKP